MKAMLSKNCGIESLERYIKFSRTEFNGEIYISIKSVLSLSEDFGYKMDAYWVSAEDLPLLEGAFILYAPDQKHFVTLKSSNRLPWFSIPKRVVVITEMSHPRFQKLTTKEKNMKGAKGEVSMPAAPQAPTAAETAKQWAEAMPIIYETQLKYAPLQAQQQVDLAKQYAGEYGLALKNAQESLYPGTSAIQEKLANQSLKGMDEGVPQWMKDQYLSDLRANLGGNVGGGVAADYTSRGLLSLNEDWRRYNQNLGLSVTGRQPLTMAGTPNTGQYSQNYDPTSVLNFGAQNFSTQGNIYGSQVQAAIASANNRMAMNQAWIGAGATALGAGLGAYGAFR